MAGNGTVDKLTPRQEGAILALLSAPTLGEAAAEAKVGERSLYRWLQESAFLAAYRVARREAVSQATARLQRACSKAVETLEAVMKDQDAPASARVSAAKTVLEMAIKGIELEDLEARITALEAGLKEGRIR